MNGEVTTPLVGDLVKVVGTDEMKRRCLADMYGYIVDLVHEIDTPLATVEFHDFKTQVRLADLKVRLTPCMQCGTPQRAMELMQIFEAFYCIPCYRKLADQ